MAQVEIVVRAFGECDSNEWIGTKVDASEKGDAGHAARERLLRLLPVAHTNPEQLGNALSAAPGDE